jgi:hypothetical protein
VAHYTRIEYDTLSTTVIISLVVLIKFQQKQFVEVNCCGCQGNKLFLIVNMNSYSPSPSGI